MCIRDRTRAVEVRADAPAALPRRLEETARGAAEDERAAADDAAIEAIGAGTPNAAENAAENAADEDRDA